MDSLRHILRNCKCCACEGPIDEVVALKLPVKANWPFPIMGNVLTGETGMAVAYVCSKCESVFLKGNKATAVKYAVEVRNDVFYYHALVWAVDGSTVRCSLKKE